jgi:MHS family metabolite:H+ symporter-like MFS transporter
MATYGTGYVARLLGAWFFGRMGDRIGRKTVVVTTIMLMGGASTLIGCLPTYQQVGLLAPVLLMILRLVQGFGAGAEISGSTVLLTEYAPRQHRGLMGSLVALGTNCGTLLASAIWLLLSAVLTEEQLIGWGWRIPFLCSFLVMFVAVQIRKHIQETPVFMNRADVVDGVAISHKELVEEAEKKGDSELVEAVKARKGKSFLIGILLRFGQTGNSTIIQTFLVGYVTSTLLVSKTVSTSALVYASLVGFVTVPLIATISDRVGRRPMYIINAVVSMLVAFPLIGLIASAETWKITLGFILIMNTAVLNLFSLENVTMAELFGARSRYTQLALSKEVGGVAATAIGPVLAATLTVAVGSWWPIAVLIVCFSVLTLVGAVASPEVAGRDLEDLRDAA